MGDVLVSGPAVRAVARQAEVVMLCGPRGADAAALLPGVHARIVWDAPWISAPAPPVHAHAVAELVAQVRAAGVDEAVILTSFHQSPLPLALLLRLAGVTRITGASVDYAGSLLDVRLRPGEDLDESIPEPERARRIAEAAGFPRDDDDRLRLGPLPDTSTLTRGTGYVVLHPGAAVPARMWTADGFARTARLLADAGRRVVISGGDAERDLARTIVSACPEAIDLTGACDLTHLAGVLAGADALVSGNTGPAHLAAAVGTPVVSLFSPVVPAERWAPYGVPVELLGDQHAACRGTRARECPVPGHPCLTSVTAEQVVAAVHRLSADRGAEMQPGARTEASERSSTHEGVSA
ncbi:glycosyltransferase family 9 protein [Microbacterium sp. NPDC089987]|uniref:glycosyltransferase family 9 protein n=1 Tax=Microbacterium sp. NPDC089987 TaxID=3364202 RepID=UPI0037F971B3